VYLLDLHVHFKRRARDPTDFAREQVERAVAVGLDGIALTEHRQVLPPGQLASLREEFAPFKIYSGVEVSCGEDFLVFGMWDPEFSKKRWDDYGRLRQLVRDHDGAICLAHPFRRRDVLLAGGIDDDPPHAIELQSRNTPLRACRQICNLATKWKAQTMFNSDAHRPQDVGCFFNVWYEFPDDDDGLVELLTGGVCDTRPPNA
jgi:predicted metal-dependent phosphoesterase TrpH